jgi:hypothetical protein
MGGSSSSSGSSSGSNSGGNKSSKKSTKKKSNSTSKYFKSTSTPKASAPIADKGMDSREAAYVKPAAKKKAINTPKDNSSGSAKTTKLASPVIKSSTSQKNAKVIASKPEKPISVDAEYDIQTRARDEQIGLQSKPSALAIKSKDTKSVATTIVAPKPVEEKKPSFIESATEAVKGLASLGPTSQIGKAIIADKYRNDEPSYNQEYWAGQRAKGVSQVDMKAQQDKIGMNKAYSGDVVVTDDMKRKASDDLKRITGSMATLQNGGVTKTEEKSGFFGEKLKTDYDYKGGPVITTKATDPVVKGYRLGDKTSTTFVDGVEVATKTGNDPLGKDAKVTKPDIAGQINDQAKIEPMDKLSTVADIQNAIETTTDKKELAALHKRLRALMRSNKTRTQFGGLRVGEAEVESTKLSGMRI